MGNEFTSQFKIETMKRVIVLLVLILVPFMVRAQDSLSIKLDKPGTLKNQIKKHGKNLVVLCISGPINNKDIAYVRTLPSLRKLDIRNSIITQGGGAFKITKIDSYEKASIGVTGNGDSYLGKYVFSSMNWETVLLPAGLKIVQDEVFTNCRKLKVLQLPDAAFEIGKGIFGKWGGLVDSKHLIFLGEANCFPLSLAFDIKELTVRNMSIYKALKKDLFDHTRSINIIHTFEDSHHILNLADGFQVPNYVDIISQYAFFKYRYEYSGLETKGIPKGMKGMKIIIPRSVRYIEEGAFCNSYIEEVEFESKSPITHLTNKTFMGCKYLQKVILPDLLESIGDNVFKGCSALASIEFPITLHSIGERAFYDCQRLSTIVLPQNLKQLGSAVFSKCDNLKSIVMKTVVPPMMQGKLGTILEEVYIPIEACEAYSSTEGWRELPLYYTGMKKKFSVEVTAPGNLQKDLETKVGKPYYKVTSSIQLIGDINTDDLEALHCLVNLEDIDLSQTTLFYGEKLKKEMQGTVGMLQLVGGLISLSDKVADKEYKQGKMSTGNYIGNKLLNKTIAGGSVEKMEKGMGKLSEDWEKKFSEGLNEIPDGSFKGYSKLISLKLPHGISSISIKNFSSVVVPEVYTSDNKLIVIQK